MRNCYFRFDKSLRMGGSVEHFYHFMWGYLLPAAFEYLRNEAARSPRSSTRFLFRSCGPVMDRRLEEVFNRLSAHFAILGEQQLDDDPSLDVIVLPRWDGWINLTWKHRADGLHIDPAELQPTIEHIRSVRKWLLDRFLLSEQSGRAAPFLLLKRSAEHAFYAPGGKAEISGYGTGRRELLGLEAAREQLTKRGIGCEIFEPGACSLAEQINAFHASRGLVCMRGAEVANLLWLKPGSKVVLFNPAAAMPVKSPARVLAHIFELDYEEIDVGSQLRPVLDAERLAASLLR
ncbi:MAG TPA: glycosyltransferase 61 family protein [Nevskiaceae bacterium]|nr:glycosyltransferase 61 family protein [Nevskiaceae bacterium]